VFLGQLLVPFTDILHALTDCCNNWMTIIMTILQSTQNGNHTPTYTSTDISRPSKAHNILTHEEVCEFFAGFPVFNTADFPSISDTRCSICFSTLSRMVFSIFCTIPQKLDIEVLCTLENNICICILHYIRVI